MEERKAICRTCGKEFILSVEEQKKFQNLGYALPTHCKNCRIKRKKDKKCQDIKNEKVIADEYRKKEDKKISDILSNPKIPIICRNSVYGTPTTLYIIGNGFDIMHGVNSSYYAFRDFIGKHNVLKEQLETWNIDEDLWANFEESLAHMNDSAKMDNALDMKNDYGVLDESDDDFSAADFFAATEFAVQPLMDIAYNLPRKFRNWVKTLKLESLYLMGEKAMPLRTIINNDAMFLSFNYTEFLETLYGVKRERIKYIHGMRKIPNFELILGHSNGAEDDYIQEYAEPRYRNQTDHDFYEVVSQRVAEYYDSTEKKSSEIIKRNQDYFDRLQSVEQIITIGHSLSKVDYPYLQEIVSRTNNPYWHVCWYSSADYTRIIDFAQKFKVGRIDTFR